jgi:bifunctional UDP-N-acetylglucosamine pyrophosphorylase/glucosamine-1-phosphate N-acetyltransferase
MTAKQLPKMTLLIASAQVPRSLLGLHVAGRPLGSHLVEGLRSLRDVRVLPLEDAKPREQVGEDVGKETEILFCDSDVWFSHAALEKMLLLASEATTPLKVVSHSSGETRGARRKETLAVYFPSSAATSILRKTSTRNVQGGVTEASRSLRGAREVSANDLDSEQPARRIRTLKDLCNLEKDISVSRAGAAMVRGVRIRDPGSITIRGDLSCGERVEIDLNVIIEGRVILGDDVKVGANTILIDATIGPRTQINPFSIVEKAEIGADTFIGPYGRVRPGSVIGDFAQIGNFVEIKNSEIGSRSRINHLTFVGDATLGKSVTLGAGTITCNHTGHGPARTLIGDGAYIGSGTELVAPVAIGEGGIIGAGSTITSDTPPRMLTIARARQVTIERKVPNQRSNEGD